MNNAQIKAAKKMYEKWNEQYYLITFPTQASSPVHAICQQDERMLPCTCCPMWQTSTQNSSSSMVRERRLLSMRRLWLRRTASARL